MKSPESRFIDKVHRQTDKNKDIWKIRMQMGMGAPKGIPDVLYRGLSNDLWVEYKYVPDIYKVKKIPWSKMSPFQIEWFERAKKIRPFETALIIGDEKGNSIFLYAEDHLIKTHKNENIIIFNPKELAEYIAGEIT